MERWWGCEGKKVKDSESSRGREDETAIDVRRDDLDQVKWPLLIFYMLWIEREN
jgi:hypothetical protein